MIPTTLKYDLGSETTLLSLPESLYVYLKHVVFLLFLQQFLILELCFYGCCHTCFIIHYFFIECNLSLKIAEKIWFSYLWEIYIGPLALLILWRGRDALTHKKNTIASKIMFLKLKSTKCVWNQNNKKIKPNNL